MHLKPQFLEWNFQQSLEWHLLDYDVHKGAQTLVKELNKLYRKEPALHKKQFSFDGFEWINHNDHENSVISYMRKSEDEKDLVIIICNLTPIPRENYKIRFLKALHPIVQGLSLKTYASLIYDTSFSCQTFL